MFDINPSDAAPIWKQIEEGMRRMVALGALGPGSAVPSVRDLARDLRVNPATVARAYQRLTDSGVFSVRRGDGTYVSDAVPAMKRSERNEVLREAATRYAGSAIAAGATVGQAVDELQSSYEKITREHGRRA